LPVERVEPACPTIGEGEFMPNPQVLVVIPMFIDLASELIQMFAPFQTIEPPHISYVACPQIKFKRDWYFFSRLF